MRKASVYYRDVLSGHIQPPQKHLHTQILHLRQLVFLFKHTLIYFCFISADAITLTGDVFVAEGEVLIELIAPSGETAFSSLVISPNILYVNESYQTISGNWKLKYKSLDGKGSIDLHLQIVK